MPETFVYKGKEYTPHTFVDELGLKQENYLSLTSFTHHPFYQSFAIEVPDNWRWALSYNLPLDELMEVMEHAVMNGYTIAWASDVSEAGFSREGIAIVPDEESPDNAGSDQHLGTEHAGMVGTIDCAAAKSDAVQSALNNRVLLGMNSPTKLMTLT